MVFVAPESKVAIKCWFLLYGGRRDLAPGRQAKRLEQVLLRRKRSNLLTSSSVGDSKYIILLSFYRFSGGILLFALVFVAWESKVAIK